MNTILNKEHIIVPAAKYSENSYLYAYQNQVLLVKNIYPDVSMMSELGKALFQSIPSFQGYSETNLPICYYQRICCYTGVTVAERIMQIAEETLSVGGARFESYDEAIKRAKQVIHEGRLKHLPERRYFCFEPILPAESDIDYWSRQVQRLLNSDIR